MKKRTNIIMSLVLMISMIQMPLLANAKSMLVAQSNSQWTQLLEEGKEETKDIVDIAISDGRFKTLVAALKAAGLVDTLKEKGPFTVFAPTDEAFAKLPSGTLDELLKPENKETLANILTYHVTPGKVLAADAMKLDGKEVTMVNGDKVKIEVKDNSVYINGAKVIITDIMAKNGVIHVIDAVIMPSEDKM